MTAPFRSGPPAEPGALPDPPPSLAPLLAPGRWEQVWHREEGGVWRRAPVGSGADRYVKVDRRSLDGPVAEAERLVWAASRSPVPVPPVLGSATGADGLGWLVTDGIAGIPAHDPGLRMGSVEGLVTGLGRGLRLVHDTLPVDGCPFDAGNDVLLARAEARVAAGGVDPRWLEPTYRRLGPERLLEHLVATRPAEAVADRVVAHGDPTQPNLLVDPATGELVGMVDLGRLGTSDRYRDLAIAVRSLAKNLGPEVVWRFLDAYGTDRPDLARLEWYALLDELW